MASQTKPTPLEARTQEQSDLAERRRALLAEPDQAPRDPLTDLLVTWASFADALSLVGLRSFLEAPARPARRPQRPATPLRSVASPEAESDRRAA